MAPQMKLEPLAIGKTTPESRNARLGHFRDLHALDRDFAIRIRKDWKSRRWIVGTGSGPIPVMETPRPAAGKAVTLAASG